MRAHTLFIPCIGENLIPIPKDFSVLAASTACEKSKTPFTNIACASDVPGLTHSSGLTTTRVDFVPVSYTHLRAHETPEHLVCRLLLEKKKKSNNEIGSRSHVN
eukprot:TRINITY_DN33809_c0_g1_i1.p1 TRINITY_DN33809_c0_g1~~TRINITY_DN33809_c0_g1_i1.p1  ORF type:complete len:104 (-),score=1.32 TRINITY_DN33809_c0_g1_i1:76-387(-)